MAEISTEKYSLCLSGDVSHWHNDIGNQSDRSGWPGELVAMVRGLVSATTHHMITPAASPHLIGLAKVHLANPIALGEKVYSLAVYVPDQGEEERRRTFFVLIPSYPGGKIKRLEEL